ncbi:uncharacterized protein LOC101849421 [Aplysia californica]|uniref:Uncharacterized protein LOC101849421 n=1 Tax=Aplysia californica TaxID=6500 RepID=A0ABM0JAM5_APLCA|nr:uncharacterized protein LOC101849421 [Aplysia californica]
MSFNDLQSDLIMHLFIHLLLMDFLHQGKTESLECPDLPNPAQGKYVCDKSGSTCRLVCHKGFVLPLSSNREQELLPMDLRAQYSCEWTAGAPIWEPQNFFDCVEEVDPVSFTFLIPLTMTPSPGCSPHRKETVAPFVKMMTKQVLGSNTALMCERDLKVTCFWNVSAACVKHKWKVDAVLRIPFSRARLENYRQYLDLVNTWIYLDADGAFRLHRQRGRTIVSTISAYLDCPPATRLDKDFICHGCSKGFYLDGGRGECRPCPPSTYQDQSLQDRCKPCPDAKLSQEKALRELIGCFHSDQWLENSDELTLLASLASVVLVATVTLFCRSKVTHEPSGQSPEAYETYLFKVSDDDVTLGVDETFEDRIKPVGSENKDSRAEAEQDQRED